MEIIFGRRPVLECLRAQRRKITKLYYQENLREGENQELLALAKDKKVPLQSVKRQWLDDKSQNAHHQGFLAEVSSYLFLPWEETFNTIQTKEQGLWVAFDEIQDPQNVGSLIRSAVCLGVEGVFILKHRSCGITPAVVRASSGATEHASVIQVTNLVSTLQALQDIGVVVFGLDASGADEIHMLKFPAKSLLVLGAEGKGLRRLTKEHCDKLVRIPQVSSVASLNVGVAGAIAMFSAQYHR
ncbi:MAG: 23S rRNA (guanosine(2251)-2'-O)-methyltransferase RlmB [Deltaproteobacteria bacterium]|nr:23S rRNA (guanosine(2251)-2'-O)-methyltransferase RlmB [Deltaproteobacteria bacterium]